MATALVIKTRLLSALRLHHHHHCYPLLFSTTSPKPPKSQSLKSIKMESGNEITEEAKENVNQKKKKIFVAGATGSTGKRIVEQLLAKGFEVKAGVRDLDKAKTILSEHNPSLQIVTADVTKGSDKLVQAIGDDSEAADHFQNPEPSVEFDTVANKKQQHAVNVAISNSFGFGGHNSVVAFSAFKP